MSYHGGACDSMRSVIEHAKARIDRQLDRKDRGVTWKRRKWNAPTTDEGRAKLAAFQERHGITFDSSPMTHGLSGKSISHRAHAMHKATQAKSKAKISLASVPGWD